MSFLFQFAPKTVSSDQITKIVNISIDEVGSEPKIEKEQVKNYLDKQCLQILMKYIES